MVASRLAGRQGPGTLLAPHYKLHRSVMWSFIINPITIKIHLVFHHSWNAPIPTGVLLLYKQSLTYDLNWVWNFGPKLLLDLIFQPFLRHLLSESCGH